MAANDEYLQEKAKLLITRERELLALKRRHRRLGLWLTLAQKLTALVDPKLDLADALVRACSAIVSVLDLQAVAFFELDGATLTPIARTGITHGTIGRLDDAAVALIESEPTAACNAPAGDAQQSLGAALGLHRFLRHRLDGVGQRPLLFVAGYDAARAAFYAPFDDDDVSHFQNTAHQLALLLVNNELLRQLGKDKELLQTFNRELERRVGERTGELARLNTHLESALESLRSKDRRLEEDIEQARLFQRTLLGIAGPSPAWALGRGIDLAAEYRPLEPVGGDLFDVCEPSPGRLRIFVADATGHGVQAAMRTIVLKGAYDALKREHRDPHILLERMAARLSALFPSGETMCTACCVDLDVGDDGGVTVVYANAGNAPIFHFSAEGPREIYGDTPFLGVGALSWPDPVVFRMAPGDALVVASDGLFEQAGAGGARFEERMRSLPLGGASSAAEGLALALGAFDAFRGSAPLADDLTVIVAHVAASVTRPDGARPEPSERSR